MTNAIDIDVPKLLRDLAYNLSGTDPQEVKAMLQVAANKIDELRKALYESKHCQCGYDDVCEFARESADLRTLVKKVHEAKGRYHSQIAMANLYEACGLPFVRPVKGAK